MARPIKRGQDSVRYTVRVRTDMDRKLRLLFAIDKKVKGQMTFNDYMDQVIFEKYVESRQKDIDIVTRVLEGRMSK